MGAGGFLERRRALPVLAVIYFAQQVTFLSAARDGQHRDVDHLKIGAWAVLSAILLLGLAPKGFWFQPRDVRDFIDDEGTRANRLEAMRIGFLFACGASIASYLTAEFQPLTVGEAAHLVLTFGFGSALLRFGVLERRAHGRG